MTKEGYFTAQQKLSGKVFWYGKDKALSSRGVLFMQILKWNNEKKIWLGVKHFYYKDSLRNIHIGGV